MLRMGPLWAEFYVISRLGFLIFLALGGCLEVKRSLDTSASNDSPHCVYLKGTDVLKKF